MASGFGLPPGVHDGATLLSDHGVVPHPCFRIDRFAYAAEQAQAGQVILLGQVSPEFDERTNRCRCGVEGGDLVVLDHLPETACIGVGRHAFEDDFGCAHRQRAINDIAVSGDPAYVGSTPEHVARFVVEYPLHGNHGAEQIACAGMLYALGFAGGAGGVENK